MMAASQLPASAMPLSQVLGGYESIAGSTMVSGLQLDSRKVKAGDLFLAMPGDSHDGRQFIEQARILHPFRLQPIQRALCSCEMSMKRSCQAIT